MGQIVEYIKIALMNIRHNKGRSILTMLGIIIGIASVIMIISVGNGLHNSVSGELNSIAGGQIYVSISDQESGKEFTQADIEAVKENVEHVAGAWQPSISLVGTVTSRKSDLRCYADGGSPDMNLGMSDPIIEGRYYTKCGWTPMDERTFKWRVRRTFINGKTAFSDGIMVDGIRGMELKFNT